MAEIGNRKKAIEKWVIAKARELGAPIPTGEHPAEGPDFRIATPTGLIGIELSEVLRPSAGEDLPPVEAESVHTKIMRIAEHDYYRRADASPVHVRVYYRNDGQRRDKRQMARSLVECVVAHHESAQPFVALNAHTVPEGFSQVLISRGERLPWRSSESGSFTVSDIYEQLALRISAKNKLLPTYRAHLPAGSAVWLLLWSAVTVSRGLPVPHRFEEWTVPFDFERVFFFSCLDMKVVEIQKERASTS